MQIQEPQREAIYCHLTKDTKESLSALAKYHRTTLTNLVEEGANLLIQSKLKQIHQNNYTNDRLKRLIEDSW